jgi:hypothetical protein
VSAEPPPASNIRDTNRRSRLVISSALGWGFPGVGCGCALAAWLLLAQILIIFGFLGGVIYPIAAGIAGDALGSGTFLAFWLIYNHRRRGLGVSDIAIGLGVVLALAIFIWSVRVLSEPSCPGCPV